MIDGGTLKYLLQAGGTTIQAYDGPNSPHAQQPGDQTLWVRLMHASARDMEPVQNFSIYSEPQTDETRTTRDWIVDEGDDCGMNHEDIIALILHCHGV